MREDEQGWERSRTNQISDEKRSPSNPDRNYPHRTNIPLSLIRSKSSQDRNGNGSTIQRKERMSVMSLPGPALYTRRSRRKQLSMENGRSRRWQATFPQANLFLFSQLFLGRRRAMRGRGIGAIRNLPRGGELKAVWRRTPDDDDDDVLRSRPALRSDSGLRPDTVRFSVPQADPCMHR